MHRWFPSIEAILFAADRPISIDELVEMIGRIEGMDAVRETVAEVVRAIEAYHAERAGGFVLSEVAGGWEFRTRAAQADYVKALVKKKPVKLSRAALEVLAIVAYRQPCTRADIDSIRGVDSSSTLRALLERQLLRILGKSDDVGRPMLYGTSEHFLNFFGLSGLGELPTLREYTELTEEHVVKLQEFEETLAANRSQGTIEGTAPETPPLPSGRAPEEVLGLDPPQAEPAEAKPAEAEPAGAEPAEPEGTEGEPTTAESSRADPPEAEPASAEPGAAQPSDAADPDRDETPRDIPDPPEQG